MSTDRYVSPLSERYASKEMQYIFSPDMKFRTWRRLWIALAETEKELGLNITQEQIDELKAHAEDINYDVAKERERQVRHDVMSHVYAYGVQCPKAKGIIVVCALAICFAIVNISETATTNASDVSFTSVITSFVTDGRILLITCGRMILKNVWALLYPRIFAASYCPAEIDSIPPL